MSIYDDMHIIENILRKIKQNGKEVVKCIMHVIYGKSEGSISLHTFTKTLVYHLHSIMQGMRQDLKVRSSGCSMDSFWRAPLCFGAMA